MKKLLVIEDDKQVRENIVTILSEEGFHVKMAQNGLIGIEIISSESFDLIICDILMPHMGGFEVLQFIKSKQEFANIPLIFLTAKIENDNINKASAMGAANYLLKPFQINDLLKCIDSTLKMQTV